MSAAAASLPAGWREIEGSADAPLRYVNTVTGHSQFEQPVQLQRHRCFPDPDPPHSQEALLADDVSGFNGLCPAHPRVPNRATFVRRVTSDFSHAMYRKLSDPLRDQLPPSLEF